MNGFEVTSIGETGIEEDEVGHLASDFRKRGR